MNFKEVCKYVFIFYVALILLAYVTIVSTAYPADLTFQFEPSQGATGNQLEYSTDLGATWSSPVETGAETVNL